MPRSRDGRKWFPSLEQYDLSDIDSYHQGTGGRIFKRTRLFKRPDPGPVLGAAYDPLKGRLVGGGCWCGEPSGHDWPGRSEGAPHPR